jgi:acyl-CoA synthetase (AMP-forming)/AMP-acid ligase II
MDSDLNRMPPGTPGEIMIRGRSLFSGYWRNSDATNDAFIDNWFRTGDVAYTDEEGYFFIVDRTKNIVIVNSSNVYPADLEKILHESSDIQEAAVIGVPDRDTGEALAACIQLREGRVLDEASVRGLFEERLADYQKPQHIIFMEELPRTSLGKVQKARLMELVHTMLGNQR